MIEHDIRRIGHKLALHRLYSRRCLMVQFYQYQIQEDLTASTRMFEAFFKSRRDAKWCRRQVQCWILLRPTVGDCIMWPPLDAPPSMVTDIQVVNIRNTVFIPLVPRFMDHRMLRRCLSLYDV
jgi:hypothetical protein